MTSTGSRDRITQEYQELDALPFPKSLYDSTAKHRHKDIMLAITYAAGCISRCVKQGSLNPQNVGILRGCLEVIGESLGVTEPAGREYLERLHRICLLLWKEVNGLGVYDTMKNFPAVIVDTSRSPRARLRPVPMTSVALSDTFWEPRRVTNRRDTLPAQYAHLEESGVLANFRRAAQVVPDGPFRGGFVFMDSDLYKWLEAAASCLASGDAEAVAKLAPLVDEAVGLIQNAQQADGYLNTAFMFEREKERWANLRDWHEMYCMGHCIQAAVAHFRATGQAALLDVARRVGDHLCETFGEGDGKVFGVDGHPEIELALVELFRATGERRYLDQADFFVRARGQHPSALDGRTHEGAQHRYWQDHMPYAELDEVTGHAVRMLYLAAGAADLALEGDEDFDQALAAQWENFTTQRMYVSGGAGARYEGEAFGGNYELPNARAYTETCAAIASVMWNYRLLALTGEAKYADFVEHTLYNAVLPGLSLDGQEYFYQNPLEDDGMHRRKPWFGCACCPPNVARLLAQLPGYFYSTTDNGDIYTHLYAEGTARIARANGPDVELTTRTRYPWEGDIEITVRTAGEFGLFLRIPAWAEGATLTVNNEPTQAAQAGYTLVRREWHAGGIIYLSLPMPARRVYCHPHVAENTGRAAIFRGPLLYCAEAMDNPGAGDLRDVVLPRGDARFHQVQAEGLDSLVALHLEGENAPVSPQWNGKLYGTTPADSSPASPVPLTLIPYYAWANRAPGQMIVWLRDAAVGS